MADLADLNHTWGGDLNLSVTGDLDTVTRTDRGQQRVLRRLLTNPGDYLFHRAYGGGLPRDVGTTIDAAKVKARIRAQLRHEQAVAASPEPKITVAPLLNGLSAQVTFHDPVTSAPVVLAFDVSDQ